MSIARRSPSIPDRPAERAGVEGDGTGGRSIAIDRDDIDHIDIARPVLLAR
jgi:hypothetical protein